MKVYILADEEPGHEHLGVPADPLGGDVYVGLDNSAANKPSNQSTITKVSEKRLVSKLSKKRILIKLFRS